jgi:hypothetical protein
MRELGIFSVVRSEVGQIIVADVDTNYVADLVAPESTAMATLLERRAPQPA